jgi:serine/threonine protein kinase
MLGPLPELWDKMSFDDEGMPRHEKMSFESEIIPWLEEGEPLIHPLLSLVGDIEAEIEPSDLPNVKEGGNFEVKKIGLEEILKPRNVRQRKHIVDEFDDEVPSFGERPRTEEEEFKEKGRHANALKISKEEVGSLYDLLSKVLRYDPEDRISTAEIEKHEWFVKDFPETSE